MPQRARPRTIYDPTNPLVEAFIEASNKPLSRPERRALNAHRPLLELISPGLLNVLDHVSGRSARAAKRVARLRRDLAFVHREAQKMGLLP